MTHQYCEEVHKKRMNAFNQLRVEFARSGIRLQPELANDFVELVFGTLVVSPNPEVM